MRTQEIIRRHVPGPPLEVLDVGGGAGVHAAWLLHDLFDQWDDAAHRDAILFAARATEAEPSLIGASAHLLMVAKRPPSAGTGTS